MLAILLGSFLSYVAVVTGQCNPLQSACPAVPGLASGQYSIDFTKQVAQPSEWILANYENVTYGSKGAEFNFAKRYDAPAMWTDFYVLFGQFEIVLQCAPGTGLITGVVLMSDDLDEIDIGEWSGNNFASSQSEFQTNYFGKGITGNYDRSTMVSVSSPQTTFHTYTLNWTPSSITWSVDGKVVRTLNNNGATSGDYQFPQTPSQLHLSLWDGGDAAESSGVVDWAGGYTDLSKAPFTAYVKSVKITTPNLCGSWQYPTKFNGTYQAVQCGGTLSTTTSSTTSSTARSTTSSTTSASSVTHSIVTTTTSASSTTSTPCPNPTTYAVQTADYYYKIATNFGISVDDLEDANPGVDPDELLVGQVLNIPAGYIGVCGSSSGVISASSLTSGTSSRASTTAPVTTPSTYTSTYTCTTECSPAHSSSSPWAWPTSYGMGATSPSSSTQSKTYPSSTSTSTPAVTALTSQSSAQITPSATVPVFQSSTIATNIAAMSSSSCPLSYVVQSGDYGYKIAGACGITFDELESANSEVDWDSLLVGDVLDLPQNATCVIQSSTCGTAGNTSSSSLMSSLPSISTSVGTGLLLIPETTTSTSSSTSMTIPSLSTTTSSTPRTTSASSTVPWSSSIMSTASSLFSMIFSSSSSTTTRPSTTPSTTPRITSPWTWPATTTVQPSTTTASPASKTSSTTPRSTTTSSVSTKSTMPSTTTHATTTTSSLLCTTDALLSTMCSSKWFTSAHAYCSSYTQSPSLMLTGSMQVNPQIKFPAMPTWMANCPLASHTASVSSACSCLPQTVSATSTTMQGGMGAGWWGGMGWRR